MLHGNLATKMQLLVRGSRGKENGKWVGGKHQIFICPSKNHRNYIPVNEHGNGKWTRIEDEFSIEHGDTPASYVSLLEGIWNYNVSSISNPPTIWLSPGTKTCHSLWRFVVLLKKNARKNSPRFFWWLGIRGSIQKYSIFFSTKPFLLLPFLSFQFLLFPLPRENQASISTMPSLRRQRAKGPKPEVV